MPVFKRDDVELYYEEQERASRLAHRAGRDALGVSSGPNPLESHRSTRAALSRSSPWITQCRQIVAPVRPTDIWHVYTATSLLADHVGIDRFPWRECHRRPYIMVLIQAAPQRVASAVGFQTIGLDDNRQPFSRCSTAGRMSSGPRALT